MKAAVHEQGNVSIADLHVLREVIYVRQQVQQAVFKAISTAPSFRLSAERLYFQLSSVLILYSKLPRQADSTWSASRAHLHAR